VKEAREEGFAEGVKKALDLVEEILDRRDQKPLGDKHATGHVKLAGLDVHRAALSRSPRGSENF